VEVAKANVLKMLSLKARHTKLTLNCALTAVRVLMLAQWKLFSLNNIPFSETRKKTAQKGRSFLFI